LNQKLSLLPNNAALEPTATGLSVSNVN